MEYEKQVVARLTNKLRALQTEKMDTTILNPKANIKDMATNTERFNYLFSLGTYIFCLYDFLGKLADWQTHKLHSSIGK